MPMVETMNRSGTRPSSCIREGRNLRFHCWSTMRVRSNPASTIADPIAEFEPANVLGMEPATIKISARSFTAALIQLPIPVAANLTVVQSCGTKQAVKVLQTPHPIAKTLLQRA